MKAGDKIEFTQAQLDVLGPMWSDVTDFEELSNYAERRFIRTHRIYWKMVRGLLGIPENCGLCLVDERHGVRITSLEDGIDLGDEITPEEAARIWENMMKNPTPPSETADSDTSSEPAK